MSKAQIKLQNLLDVEDDVDSESDKDTNTDENKIIDVTVSFDGMWAKRGFASLFGAFFVMSVDTGEVLDYHILSKFCQKCAKKNECADDLEKFETWKVEHIVNGECDIATEAKAAKILWNRSIEKHNFWTHMMGLKWKKLTVLSCAKKNGEALVKIEEFYQRKIEGWENNWRQR